MPDDGAAGGLVARPVVARYDCCRSNGHTPPGIRAGQDVVLIRLVSDAVDLLAVLINGRWLSDVVAIALEVPMQVGDVGCDQLTVCVEPGAAADPRSRVDRGLWGCASPACLGGAEIGSPRAVAAPAAAASIWQCASAPASPPRFPPSPGPTLVTKNPIGACCASAILGLVASVSNATTATMQNILIVPTSMCARSK